MLTIVRKLERYEYIPAAEFLQMVNEEMELVDDRFANCSLRTLQRDLKTIEELFGITVSCDSRLGYHIQERDKNSEYNVSLFNGLDVMSFVGSV